MFELLAQDGRARRGVLHTVHGDTLHMVEGGDLRPFIQPDHPDLRGICDHMPLSFFVSSFYHIYVRNRPKRDRPNQNFLLF